MWPTPNSAEERVSTTMCPSAISSSTWATDSGLAEALYVARGGFFGLNGNYRGGMLEGIAHFHPQVTQWLQAGHQPAGIAPV